MRLSSGGVPGELKQDCRSLNPLHRLGVDGSSAKAPGERLVGSANQRPARVLPSISLTNAQDCSSERMRRWERSFRLEGDASWLRSFPHTVLRWN